MPRNLCKSILVLGGRLAAMVVLAAASAAPAAAQSNMSGGKTMHHGHMMNSTRSMSAADKSTWAKMSASEKKVTMMPTGAKMTSAQKQTLKRMTASEKSLAMKMMKVHSGMHGGKMGAKTVAMTCPHCKVAMKNGKCPMCGMTMSQMKQTKMKKM